MAKIENAKVKPSSGGCKRLFDDERLGHFISKLESTVISNGSELKRMIVSQSSAIDDSKDNLDYFVREIIKIPSFMKKYRELMSNHIRERDFYSEGIDEDVD